MADISNVKYEEIKDIYERLEGLSCKFQGLFCHIDMITNRTH